MSAKVTLSAEDCHWMAPLLPVKVSNTLFPVQVVPPPEIEPATGAALTVTVTVPDVAGAHTPLVTIALK
jgi:hypothetical protein